MDLGSLRTFAPPIPCWRTLPDADVRSLLDRWLEIAHQHEASAQSASKSCCRAWRLHTSPWFERSWGARGVCPGGSVFSTKSTSIYKSIRPPKHPFPNYHSVHENPKPAFRLNKTYRETAPKPQGESARHQNTPHPFQKRDQRLGAESPNRSRICYCRRRP